MLSGGAPANSRAVNSGELHDLLRAVAIGSADATVTKAEPSPGRVGWPLLRDCVDQIQPGERRLAGRRRRQMKQHNGASGEGRDFLEHFSAGRSVDVDLLDAGIPEQFGVGCRQPVRIFFGGDHGDGRRIWLKTKRQIDGFTQADGRRQAGHARPGLSGELASGESDERDRHTRKILSRYLTANWSAEGPAATTASSVSPLYRPRSVSASLWR